MLGPTTGRRIAAMMPGQEAMTLLPKTGEGQYAAGVPLPNVRRAPATRDGVPLGHTWWDFSVYGIDQLAAQPKVGDNVRDAAGVTYIVREPVGYRFFRTVGTLRAQQATGV